MRESAAFHLPHPTSRIPHLTSESRVPHRHSQPIMAGEAAAVCSHYDLGVVHEVRRFRRGSGHSPKVLLKTSKGLFLLKRRGGGGAGGPTGGEAPQGRADPHRVAISHEAQLYLAS